ncbi:hypothetical protein M5M_01132 [Simiduia agarivorans SA1 = DSM 21679]|uniref:Uncharacterized protein n=1 Tax=Simiduia agarivorans (strain DSM 21679 / JCM 13881 / BCRC 17597 / SA1) TaxID=1117647 RepID=R9S4W0_SIMAS|nr:hypothetical protein M5M_01132 [Simiduia agarivorans SA1 = DSM 21679]
MRTLSCCQWRLRGLFALYKSRWGLINSFVSCAYIKNKEAKFENFYG